MMLNYRFRKICGGRTTRCYCYRTTGGPADTYKSDLGDVIFEYDNLGTRYLHRKRTTLL